MKLLTSLSDYLPPCSEIDSFEIGYLEGRKQVKRWIISEKDITEMYENEGEEITLWCDGKDIRKRKNLDGVNPEVTANKCSKNLHESHIEELSQELTSIHGDKFNYAQYKLWARMMANKQHTDKNIPPIYQ